MHHTIARCSARSARVPCGERGFSPLDELDRAFLALAGTGRVGLPRELVSEGQGGVLPVDEIRAALAHPATTPEARTRIWREAVVRAQGSGEPWGLVAAGLAVPVLRRVLARLPRGGVVESAEVEQEVLAAFVAALAIACPESPELDRELVAAADQAAHRYTYAACRRARLTQREVRHDTAVHGGQVQVPVPVGAEFGDEYQVLLRAVRAGVVTCREAQVIGRSRLGGESMTALAVEWGMSRRHLYRCREAAEQRLSAFLREAPA